MSSLICDKCNKIQPPANLDEFELFDLNKKFSVDIQKIEDKYLKLQQLFHPDKFSNFSEKEQKHSTLLSSLINEAYEKLINPIDRANLLLKLNGFETSSDNKSFDDKSVLDEIMEIQTKCIEAEDHETKELILTDLNHKIKNIINEMTSLFDEKKFDNFYKLNIKLSYLEKIKKNLKLK